jgi:hypothetical protein
LRDGDGSLHHPQLVHPLRALPTIVAAMAALAVAAPAAVDRAWAGGGGFGADDDDTVNAGPPYLGVVQDQDGKDLPDTKITVTIAKLNSSLVLRSDTVGHFFVRGFDKSVDPKDVTITCSKEGYSDAKASMTPPAGTAPIQAICVLKKE